MIALVLAPFAWLVLATIARSALLITERMRDGRVRGLLIKRIW